MKRATCLLTAVVACMSLGTPAGAHAQQPCSVPGSVLPASPRLLEACRLRNDAAVADSLARIHLSLAKTYSLEATAKSREAARGRAVSNKEMDPASKKKLLDAIAENETAAQLARERAAKEQADADRYTAAAAQKRAKADKLFPPPPPSQ